MPVLDELHRRRQRREIDVDAAGQHLGERLRRPLERNDLTREAGRDAEPLHGQMRRRAEAGGRIVELSGFGLGVSDELLSVLIFFSGEITSTIGTAASGVIPAKSLTGS